MSSAKDLWEAVAEKAGPSIDASGANFVPVAMHGGEDNTLYVAGAYVGKVKTNPPKTAYLIGVLRLEVGERHKTPTLCGSKNAETDLPNIFTPWLTFTSALRVSMSPESEMKSVLGTDDMQRMLALIRERMKSLNVHINDDVKYIAILEGGDCFQGDGSDPLLVAMGVQQVQQRKWDIVGVPRPHRAA